MSSPPNFAATLLALSALASPSAAELELSWQEAVLGHALHYELQGDPGELYVWIPSFSPGPVCLCLLDPLDPRNLDVGVDLITLAQSGILSATGQAEQLVPLPKGPALAGIQLYMQALTVPGTTTQVDDLSNPVKVTLSFPGQSHFTAGEMVAARRFARATTLANGQVLITGGLSPTAPTSPLDSAEIFDPQTQAFRPSLSTLPQPRARHTQTVLDNGRVLLVGGVDDSDTVLNSTVLYDPTTDTFVQAAPMNTPRVLHSATLLTNGKVLVLGGGSGFDVDHPIGYPDSVADPVASSSEIYDPAVNSWTPGASLPSGILAHSVVRLEDGRLLVAGGVEAPGGVTPVTTDAAWIFDPTGTTVSPTSPLPAKRYHMGSAPRATGGALMVGGTNVDFATLAATVHAEMFVYDSQQNIWTNGPSMPAGTRCGELNCVDFVKTITEPSVICPIPPCEIQCNVYFTGGGWDDLQMSSGIGVPNTDLYQLDQDLTSWTPTTTTLEVRPGMSMAPIDGGLRFLIIGSADDGAPIRDRTAEIVIPIL